MTKTTKSSDSFSFDESWNSVLPPKLLAWYDVCGRDLPWRTRGAHPDPYSVWVSEIMLQQTTVKTVIPYFLRFLEKFPDISSLADAEIEDVLLMWQGLGYYTRAKKMHECARYLIKNNGGVFPGTYDGLIKLPGIGPYTAASISSLAFDQPEAVIDGNVIRVLSRLYGIRESTARSLPVIEKKARFLMPKNRAADYTSAIMDLGATVCVPKNPLCGSCPFREYCVALKENTADEIPKIVKIQKIKKSGVLYWIKNDAGAVYVRKRTEKGLLSGLTEFPWFAAEASESYNTAGKAFLVPPEWENTGKSVRHVFTHIDLRLDIYEVKMNEAKMNEAKMNKTVLSEQFNDGEFVLPENFKDYPFSTLMKKVIREMEAPRKAEKTKQNTDLTQF